MNDVYDRNQKKALIADNDRLRAENADLIHDIERHVAIASQLATEVAKLRAALEKIGKGKSVLPAYEIARAALNEETKLWDGYPKDDLGNSRLR